MRVAPSDLSTPIRMEPDRLTAMSIKTDSSEPTCKTCEKVVDLSQTFRDAYCSERCCFADKGEGIMQAQIPEDSTLCATCFAKVKEVERPSDEWVNDKADKVRVALDNGAEYTDSGGMPVLDATDCPTRNPTASDSVTGFASRTKNATKGTDIKEPSSAVKVHRSTTVCQCGNVNARNYHAILRNDRRTLEEVRDNLFNALRYLNRKGAINRDPEKELLREAYEQVYPPTRKEDWYYITGKALYAND